MAKKKPIMTKQDISERRRYYRKLKNVRDILKRVHAQDEIHPPMTEGLFGNDQDGNKSGSSNGNVEIDRAVQEIESLIATSERGGNLDASFEDSDSSGSEDEQRSQEPSAGEKRRRESEKGDVSSLSDEEAADLVAAARAKKRFRHRQASRHFMNLTAATHQQQPLVYVDLSSGIADRPSTSTNCDISVPIAASATTSNVQLPTHCAQNGENEEVVVVDLDTSMESDSSIVDADVDTEVEESSHAGHSCDNVPDSVHMDFFLETIRQQEAEEESDDPDAPIDDGNNDQPRSGLNESSNDENDEREQTIADNAESGDDDQVQCDANDEGQACKLNYQGFLEYFRKEASLDGEALRHRSYTEIFSEVARKTYINEGVQKMMFDLHRARDKVYLNQKRRALGSCRKMWMRNKPKVKMSYEFREIATGRICKEERLHKFPRKRYPASQFLKISEFAVVNLYELFMHSQRLHGRSDLEPPMASKGTDGIDFFMDGVPLAKSSPDKLDVVLVRFPHCKLEYIYGMHVYKKDCSLTANQILEKFITEAKFHDFRLNRIIGDAPIRARLKCLKTFAGFYSCECCLARGISYLNRVVFPSETMNAEPRTDHWWNTMIERIEENGGIENIDADELKGLTGISPLSKLYGHDTSYFSMVKGFTVEPMHNIGGCIKQLIRLMFNLSKTSVKLSAEQTRKLRLVDKRWIEIRLPREFNRRNRELVRDIKHFKSQEYFSLVGAGFLAVADAMDLKDDLKKKEVWLRFAFLVRLVMFPNKQWHNFKVKIGIWIHMWTFYRNFEKAFGLENCSWNIHTFSHLIQLRDVSNLPDGTALFFEGFFNILKKVMKSNTPSFTKQVMDIMIANNVRAHDCKPIVRFSSKDRPRYGDNLIYTDDGDFYQIESIGDDHYKAKKFLTGRFETPEVKSINWGIVGVKHLIQLNEEIHVVKKANVIGKASIDQDVIISMPFAFAFV